MSSAVRLEFGVADCGNSSWRSPDGNIHRRCLSCSDRAGRFGIAVDPVDLDQNVRSRLTNHLRSRSLGDVNDLARALLPVAAAFAVAMRD